MISCKEETKLKDCSIAMNTKPKPSELDEALQTLVNWQDFAIHLPEMDDFAIISSIKNDCQGSVIEAAKTKLLEKWLGTDDKATWSSVVKALERAREYALAKSVEEYVSSLSTAASAMNTKPKPSQLKVALKRLVNWQGFAIYLPGMDDFAIIGTIKNDCQGSEIETAKKKMLEKWLSLDKNPTWSSVVEALERAEEKSLAKRVEEYVSSLSAAVSTTTDSTNEATDGTSTGQDQPRPVAHVQPVPQSSSTPNYPPPPYSEEDNSEEDNNSETPSYIR